MFSSNHPIIIPSDSDIEDALSSTNALDYTSALSNYSLTSPGSTSFNYLEDSRDGIIPPAFSPLYNNPYIKNVSKGPATRSNLRSVSVTCHACGEKGHYKRQCSKTKNSTFHVSNLKKCLSDESLVILKKEIWLDDKLNFVEEQGEIVDREVKQLRQIRIPIVKVRWNSEFTWEREDQIRAKYPHLFSNTTPSSN
nr:putative reverse transcriptase domain-containing protein [Tanacetum cinerariifolium]